ncbi:MAG: SIMPL domain-containing protein [Rhizobiaceae bacterium]|jgi:uncharacterized protein YggE
MRKTLLAMAMGAAILPGIAAAQSQPPPRIVVMGEGEAVAPPDMALLSLSVMREAKTAREALDANNDAMAAVISAMKGFGIEERDLQTAGIQINPRYNYENKPDGSQTAELVAYQVTNTLSIRVRDLQKTGEIIDRSVSLGVNQGGSVSFANDDPSTVIAQAREKAVADAFTKAKTLSKAAGVSLGRVLEISEQNSAPPPGPIMAKAMPFDSREAVPIQAGENAYRVQVNVVFELR